MTPKMMIPLLGLAWSASVALADETRTPFSPHGGYAFQAVLDINEPRTKWRIEDTVKSNTGLRPKLYPGVLDERTVVVTAVEDFSGYETTVLLHEVSENNLQDKIEELIGVISTEFSEVYEYGEYKLRHVNHSFQHVGPSEGGARMIETGMGALVGGGKRPFGSVWVNLPPVLSNDQTLNLFGGSGAGRIEGKSHWLRTELLVDGTLTPPSAGDAPILVTRMRTHIYEFRTRSKRDSGFDAVQAGFRIGSVKASVLHSEEMDPQSTMELDYLQFASSYSFVGRNVDFYVTMNGYFGLRLLERNAATFRATMGSSVLLGVVFHDRFFIEAGTHIDGVFGDGMYQRGSYGGSVGWKASDLLSFRLSGGYTVEDVSDGAQPDPMYVVPTGWNFNASVAHTF